LKFKCVKQHDATDCAAACLATICLSYGKDITITRLRDIAGTDVKGTTVKGTIMAAEQLGFTAKAVRIDRDGFTGKYTLPAIAHLITKEGLSHFVTVFKVNKKRVVYADPAKGKVRQSIDEFFEQFDGVMILLAPTNDFKPEKKNQSMAGKFIKLLTPQKGLFASAIVASVILTVLGIVSSFFNKVLVDDILPYNLKNQLAVYCIAFILIALVQVGISATRQQMLLYLSQKINIPLLIGYFKHIFSLPIKFFATRKTGDILTRFSDAFTITNVFTGITLSLAIDIVLAVASAVILYIMNSTLFFVVVVLTIISAALVFIFKRPYKKINLRKMEQQALMNSQVIDSLRGIETVKSMANENESLEKIEEKYIGSLRIAFQEGVLQNAQGSISGVISSVGNMVIMWLGASMVMNNNITLGTLMTFSTLSGYFMGPIGRLINLQLSVQEASIAMRRLSEILEVEPEQAENSSKHKPQTLDGDVVLENITFRYGARSPVLKNVSLTIPKGKKVALVGESGSGKTTLSKLVMGLWKPEEGKIHIGGYDVEEIDLPSLRDKIAYVPQNVELFSDSIINNIKFGNKTATYEQVRDACRDAGCDGFIEKLPGRYDTFLQEAGADLSGGERQRLALARAFIKEPQILLLDEATSNLDFLSEAKIYDTLFRKMKSTTMLIVAHRLSTIRKCDIICVMDKGGIVESGTHDELLNRKGAYYKLWASQVGLDEPSGIEAAATQIKADTEPSESGETGDECTY
jgi:ABC-type bacteriocin transporter